MTETPNVVDVLRAHALTGNRRKECACGWHQNSYGTTDINHPHHVAEMLAALVPLIDRAKAVELRRIADERWNRNLIAPADLRHWLRARADELDPPAKEA